MEELIIHYKASDESYADLTYIPRVSVNQNGLDLTINIEKEIVTYDENWSPVVSRAPLAGATVKIGDTEYMTDAEGNVTLDIAFGTYQVLVYKEGNNYPELVRSEFEIDYENPWEGDSIDVRVEGPNGVLYDTSVTVRDETNGLDLLKSAIGETNIQGYTGTYGYFVTGIVDGEGKTISGTLGEGYTTSWGLYEKRNGQIESSGTGIEGISLEALEELIIHYKASDASYADLTFIPRVSVTQNGLEVTIRVDKETVTYDENWNPLVSQLPFDGATVKIGDTEYMTDAEGNVTLDIAFGTYQALVYKEGDNYPELVRSEFEINYENPWEGDSIDVRVEGPNGVLYDTSVTVTDETNGFELLESAIGADNIVLNGSGMLSGIVDTEGTTISGLVGDGYSTSWGLYEERNGEIESSSTGIDGISIEGLGELLIHYKAVDSSWADLTFIPRVSTKQNGLNLEITVSGEGISWDANFNMVVSESAMVGAIVKIGDTEYTTDENGVARPDLDFGSYEVSVYKEGDNYPELVRSEISLVLDDESGTGGDETPDQAKTSIFDGMTNWEVIEQVVTEMRSSYGKDTAFSFREALGYLNSGSEADKSIIADKIVLRSVINQTTDLAANILSVNASGLDPSAYEGGNYVQQLIDIQKEDGVFEIGGEGVYPTQLAWGMVALDLAGGVYNVTSATAALILFQNEDGGFGSLDATAMALPALANHGNETGASEAIADALDYLSSGKNGIIANSNQYSIAAVINGICSVGENPLADKWANGDDTLLTRLMYFYEEGSFGNSMADEQAFLALSDLYSHKSVFTGQEIGSMNYDMPFIAEDEQSSGNEPAEDSYKASVSVKGLNGRIILSGSNYDFDDGDTVLDITKAVLTREGISYDANGEYMAEIDGLAEFDNGAQSGWMYKINGNFPDYGASGVRASDVDDIVWLYTTNMGIDVGDNSSSSGNTPNSDFQEEAEQILEDPDATLDEIGDAFDKIIKADGEEEIEVLMLLAEAAIKRAGEISLEMDGEKAAELGESAFVKMAMAAANQAEAMREAFDDEGIILDKFLESKVTVSVETGGDAASVEFASGALGKAFGEKIDEVAIASPWAELAFAKDTLSDEDMDKAVVLEVKTVDLKELPEGADVPKGASVIDLNLYVDGVKKTNFNGAMTISIPFNPEADESGELTVYWLQDDGTIVPVGGSYNEETGMIVFETTHFSKYFVDESSASFSDMENAAWAEEEVCAMAGKGFINGRSQGVFDPSNDISRAEFAAIIARMLNLSVPEDYYQGFIDVDETDWFVGAVSSVNAGGFMKGKGNGSFDPNGKITRQEQAIVLANVLNRYGYADGTRDLDDEFSDAERIASWAKDGAVSAVHHGLIKGIGGRFDPIEKATRAQSALMLYRLYVKIMK